MQKIVTLTMNPALDVAAPVPTVAPEIKLRCGPPRYHPGGGGINVSRAVHFLGGSSSAVYAAGGHTGRRLSQLLAAEGISQQPVPVKGETRQSFVVFEESSSLQYRFNLPGPALSAAEWRACSQAVFDLQPEYIVASGSLPGAVPAEFYGEIAHRARQRGIRLVLDTAGAPLRQAAGVGLHLLKPNLSELEQFAGTELTSEAQIAAAGQRLIGEGAAAAIVVSMGAAGAALITADGYLHARAPIVPIRSKVGAGDSMVAGIVMRLAQGFDLLDALRFGVACGSAAVMTPGTRLCRREDAYRLYDEIARQA